METNQESPPQHYRQIANPRNNQATDACAKPVMERSAAAFNQYSNADTFRQNGASANYSKSELSSVQGYGTLPRRSKKSSSSSGNSCVTTIQVKVTQINMDAVFLPSIRSRSLFAILIISALYDF